MDTAHVQVLITTAERVLFNGPAQSLSLPGESGTFEVRPLHRPLVSRLVEGTAEVAGHTFAIRRGVVRVADDVVTAVVELPDVA